MVSYGCLMRLCAAVTSLLTYLASLLGLILSSLVVKVLEVLVNSGILCVGALGKHGPDTTGGGGRVAVHGLVEGGITLTVLSLELNVGGCHVE